MAILVFDIETSALPVEQFDEAQREYLFRDAEKLPDEAAREAKRTDLRSMMSLWPFTSQVVCIAMLNADSSKGQVLFIADDFEANAAEVGPVEFVPCVDEAELLTAFWDVARTTNRSSPSTGVVSTCRSFTSARPNSASPSPARIGWATGLPSNPTVIWPSN